MMQKPLRRLIRPLKLMSPSLRPILIQIIHFMHRPQDHIRLHHLVIQVTFHLDLSILH